MIAWRRSRGRAPPAHPKQVIHLSRHGIEKEYEPAAYIARPAREHPQHHLSESRITVSVSQAFIIGMSHQYGHIITIIISIGLLRGVLSQRGMVAGLTLTVAVWVGMSDTVSLSC